jgi:hypothetical protein
MPGGMTALRCTVHDFAHQVREHAIRRRSRCILYAVLG